MCTLAVMKNLFKGYPLVVVANRDEQFSRPSATPSVSEEAPKILAPTDLQRGGTWIGVNEYGVLVALTNRKAVASVRGLRSRGELVSEALKRRTATEALASVMNREPGEHNACYMLFADMREGYVATGNGVGGVDPDGRDIEPGFTCEPLADGLTIVTNLGLGPDSPRGGAIMREWEKLRPRRLPPPRFSTFVPMLTRHDADTYGERFRGRDPGTVCLHPTEDDPDYGSVSSSVIRLSDTYGGQPLSWHYWHGTRKRASATFCHVTWSSMMTLPIRSE